MDDQQKQLDCSTPDQLSNHIAPASAPSSPRVVASPPAHPPDQSTGVPPVAPAPPLPPPPARTASPALARLGDRNRKFVLLSLTYPAILGTIIWETLGAPFATPVAWLVAALIIAQFTLDFLYLKINVDYYGAEDDFRYGWGLFTIDLTILGLVRAAFTSSKVLPDPQERYVNPFIFFTLIYGLYLLWEFVYYLTNKGHKRSSQSTPREYAVCFLLFFLCVVFHRIQLSHSHTSSYLLLTNGVFVVTLAYTVYRHYVSVFRQVRQE